MEQAGPLVSVIIPTYNRCGMLLEAIESVLVQTYSRLEVVVVDDGSSDGTQEAVEELDDRRVRYIRQANAGRSAARNRGMAAAKGEYLAFLDDDDTFLPHKVAHQVDFMEKHPDVDLVSAGIQFTDAGGAVQSEWRPWKELPRLTLLDCLYNCPLPTCAVFFRRRILAKLDHWFDSALEPAEDSDFFLRLLAAGCRMDWLPEMVATYRMHGASSQSNGARYSRVYQSMLDKLFVRPDLPADVLAERERVRAHYHLAGACQAYAAGQVESAQADLVRALALDPGLQEGSPPPLAVDLANFAGSFRVADARAYIHDVFDQLPASLAHMRRLRRETLTAFYMGRVFRAHEAGERPSLKDWWLGVRYAPRWLRNRGVWSILVREIVGLPSPA